MPEDPSAVAVHEAGHAVVALLEGLWFPDVVMPGTLSAERSAGNLDGGIEVIQADPKWSLEADLRSSVAGPLAERRIAQLDDYPMRFEAHVDAYRLDLRLAGKDPETAIIDATHQVDEIFDATDIWEAVLAVARQLDVSRRLGVLEVRRLLLDALGESSYPVADRPPPPPGGEINRVGVFDHLRLD